MHDKFRFLGKNKKAQVGETITWVVATVIIIVVLLVAIFFVNLIFKGDKQISNNKVADTLASKSFFSYLLTKNQEGKAVFAQLKDEDNLNEFNGLLGRNIFLDYYGEEYEDVWLGVRKKQEFFVSSPNSYFEPEGGIPVPAGINIFEEIRLSEDTSTVLALVQQNLPGLEGLQ